jgi:hypothetical protein
MPPDTSNGASTTCRQALIHSQRSLAPLIEFPDHTSPSSLWLPRQLAAASSGAPLTTMQPTHTAGGRKGRRSLRSGAPLTLPSCVVSLVTEPPATKVPLPWTRYYSPALPCLSGPPVSSTNLLVVSRNPLRHLVSKPWVSEASTGLWE